MKLIEEIRKQNHLTILDFLDEIQGNASIYSNETDQFEYHVAKNKMNVILIAPNEKEAVLLLIDVVKPGTVELADEERFNNEDPLYFCESSTRVSPVWLLTCAAQHLIKSCERADIHGVNVGCVVISNSMFVNYEDMCDTWDEMNVTVFHNIKGIKSFHFATNKNDSLKGSLLYHTPMHDTNRLFPATPYMFPETCFQLNSSGDETQEDCYARNTEEAHGPELYPCKELKAESLPPIKNPLEVLNRLVGCQEIKKRIYDLTMLSQYNQRLKEIDANAKTHKLPLHSLFMGNPGTGKTTVCRIFGSLLKEAGALSKGHVVVCNRGTFVGNMFGDEESSVSMAIREARGGVLMIDEAYLLNSNHHADPGKLVLPLLMDVLADESQRDIAIILCGYRKPMEQMLELNPGLESRFPNRFEFPDFTEKELLDIAHQRLKDYQYSFTRTSWEQFKSIVSNDYKHKEPDTWGNARYIANLLENIYLHHARRCVKSNINDPVKLHMLTKADVQPPQYVKKKQYIGFK